jgi:hypothetical protein
MYFADHIKDLSNHECFKHRGNAHDEILDWYDGYSWDGKTRVVNPFSLLTFFSKKEYGGFWYASGTPKFLIEIMKKKPESFLHLKNPKIRESVMDDFDIDRIEIESLLFQTGYLTVNKKEFISSSSPVYVLEMPNLEVKEAFNLHIISAFTENSRAFTESSYMRIKDALADGDLQGMLDQLKGLFASIPYEIHVNAEAYYHSIFFAIMNVLGFDIGAEVSVSGGRIDAVLEHDDKVYIMEFKYKNCPPDASADVKQKHFENALKEGMEQIENRGYHEKYMGSGKTIYKAAFAFLGRDDIQMRFTSWLS